MLADLGLHLLGDVGVFEDGLEGVHIVGAFNDRLVITLQRQAVLFPHV